MKKFTILITLFFASIMLAMSQTTPVEHYVFTQAEETYTEISGGTVHGDNTNYQSFFNGIELGFTFNFDAVDYTTISIQSNGFIKMGSSFSGSNPYSPLSTSSSYGFNTICAYASRIKSCDDGELMSITEGTAPNRVFTVQWKNYNRGGTPSADERVNFQIKLYETSNKIELVYGEFIITNDVEFGLMDVGIKGTVTTDVLNIGNTYDLIVLQLPWNECLEQENKARNFVTHRDCKPISGQTYIFEQPYSIDAGIHEHSNPDRTFTTPGNQNIEVLLKNYGTTTLTSATIKWKVNDGTVHTQAWSGSLAQNATETVTMTEAYDFTAEDYYTVESWVESPNGTTDDHPENDNYISKHTLNEYCTYHLGYDDDGWGTCFNNLIIGDLVHLDCKRADMNVDNYDDFSSHMGANLSVGMNVYYYVHTSGWAGYAAFWIDFNDDNDFDDEGEFMGLTDYLEAGGNNYADGEFTIPVDAQTGMHRMRARFVVSAESGATAHIFTAGDACSTIWVGGDFGEEGDTHDYFVNVYSPNSPPPCASIPTPTNFEVDVAKNIDLAWQSTDATNFDVYFGTNTTPPFIVNQTENSYDVGVLDENTTYYWKVIAKNDFGSATDCDTWSFTTGENLGYCIPPYSDCDEWGDAIDDFYLADIQHENSGCSFAAGDLPMGYGDFTYMSTDLIQGGNYVWSADYGTQDGLGIWIDFNDDGEFNETDEFVYHTYPDDQGQFQHIETDNFNLPPNTPLGEHRMRVRCSYNITYFEGNQACVGVGSGETHDYTINIVTPTEPPQCAINPNPANTSIEASMNTTLAWTASNAVNYDVYFGTTELTYMGEVSEMSYDPGVLNADTEYQWKIVPKNSFGPATGCDTWTFTTSDELTYCSQLYNNDGEHSCVYGDQIEDVIISDLNHTGTSCDSPDGTAVDFTYMTINLEQGVTYSTTVEVGIDQSWVGIWLDVNNDGDFAEDECLHIGELPNTVTTLNTNLVIPASISLGEHRIRFRTTYTSINAETGACIFKDYGEAHDYTAYITESATAPSCAINPFPANSATEQYLNVEPLTWDADFATEYDVYFGTDATPSLVSENQVTAIYDAGLLEANTTYYWKIIPSNTVGGPTDCDIWSFTTGENLNYCTEDLYTGDQFGGSSSWGDYIGDFIVETDPIFEHLATGYPAYYGYQNFDFLTIEMEQGGIYDWTITSGLNNQDNVAIWIDYNDDGTFNSSDEFIYATESVIPLSYSDTLAISATANPGEHAMRVRLRAGTDPMTGVDACTLFTYGETHDYTANISEVVGVNSISGTGNINIFPNPANNFVNIEADNTITNIKIFNYLGQQLIQVNENTNICQINVSSLNSGVYFIKIDTKNGNFVKKLVIQ